MKVKLEPSWLKALSEEFEKPYFANLAEFVKKEYQSKKVFPEPSHIFRALELTPFDQVKVVILGQDPYHGEGQANGLAFAVNRNINYPPSLRNIYKELQSDLGVARVPSRDLLSWAKQGVLLLNATLTVVESKPASHQKVGWEEFTDAIIRALIREREHLVFILWGAYARRKGSAIDHQKHLVIESAHPSPLSAHNGFFGSKPFSRCNNYLLSHSRSPISWVKNGDDKV